MVVQGLTAFTQVGIFGILGVAVLCSCSAVPVAVLLEHDISANGQLDRQMLFDG